MQNLYQVDNGEDLRQLIADHRERIAVVLYSDDSIPGCKSVKPLYIKASKSFTQTMFIFLDLNRYDDRGVGFTANLEGALPQYSFFYDLKPIARVSGPHFDKFVNTLQYLLGRLAEMQATTASTAPPSTVPEAHPSSDQPPSASKSGTGPPSPTTPTVSTAPETGDPSPAALKVGAVTAEQLTKLKKLHQVQKQMMLMEMTRLEKMRSQQQKVMLNQCEQLERIRDQKERAIRSETESSG